MTAPSPDDRPGMLFGERLAGVSYRYRPAVFGILEKSGLIALVHVSRSGDRTYYDLPGGAIDGEETSDQALLREFGEETGLVVEVGQFVASARQLFTKSDGEAVENSGAIYEVRFLSFRPDLKIEEDHTLAWMEPILALTALRHESHAWALTRWLRRKA